MKIVINKKYGGFGLSHKAVMRYAELCEFKLYPWLDDITKKVYGEDIKIDDPRLPLVHYSKHPTNHSNKYYFSSRDIERTDPNLIKVIKELGKEANSQFSNLQIIDIPDDVEWEIKEYDGMEWIAEKHRTWS